MAPRNTIKGGGWHKTVKWINWLTIVIKKLFTDSNISNKFEFVNCKNVSFEKLQIRKLIRSKIYLGYWKFGLKLEDYETKTRFYNYCLV